MRMSITGVLVGTVAAGALATPGAVYMAQVRRPVVQPTERITVTETVTVPGPTVTVTATETEKVRERITERVTVADPELETGLLAPDPATARTFVRGLFLQCVGRPPVDEEVAEGADVYLRAYREGNDAEARTREWLHAKSGSPSPRTTARRVARVAATSVEDWPSHEP